MGLETLRAGGTEVPFSGVPFWLLLLKPKHIFAFFLCGWFCGVYMYETWSFGLGPVRALLAWFFAEELNGFDVYIIIISLLQQ
jgi:hypothetical protein